MNEYLKLFETTSQYNAYTADTENFILPNVSLITETYTVHYNPYVHDYSKDYLTFISSSDNNAIGWKAVQQSNNSPIRTISYSTDKTNWTSVASTSAGVTLATLNSGDKLYLKGTENNYGKSYQGTSWSQFTSSGQFTAEGNIMSLIGGDNFSVLTSFTSSNEGAFTNLFKGCTSLIDISNLMLPATTLADYCYYGMFYGCTALTTAPLLPTTTLAESCYKYMFSDCTSLTTAPELPATTLANNCYNLMFNGCTSLTVAPQLPATTLAEYCYNQMFYECTSLTTAPLLPTTTLAEGCYSHMFLGCTSLTTAPELPATTLTNNCYIYMFYGCSKLNNITCLATDISTTGCTNKWVSGVASSGTFTKNASMSSWTRGTNGIPSNWTVVDAS